MSSGCNLARRASRSAATPNEPEILAVLVVGKLLGELLHAASNPHARSAKASGAGPVIGLIGMRKIVAKATCRPRNAAPTLRATGPRTFCITRASNRVRRGHGKGILGGEIDCGKQCVCCGRREPVFSRRCGEKAVPQVQRSYFDVPLERDRPLLSRRSGRHSQRQRRVVLSRTEAGGGINCGPDCVLEGRPRGIVI